MVDTKFHCGRESKIKPLVDFGPPRSPCWATSWATSRHSQDLVSAQKCSRRINHLEALILLQFRAQKSPQPLGLQAVFHIPFRWCHEVWNTSLVQRKRRGSCCSSLRPSTTLEGWILPIGEPPSSAFESKDVCDNQPPMEALVVWMP